MTPEEITSLLTDVRRLRQGFARTAPQPWTATTAAAELTVQLGHLALCLLRRQADTTDIDDSWRPITNIGDELSDVLLAALSVTTLAGVEPADVACPCTPSGDGDVEAFLRLLIAAGQLAEAAMVGEGFRHQPAGTPSSIPLASARTVTACDALADHLGLHLLSEFRAMVTDAEAFLDTWDNT